MDLKAGRQTPSVSIIIPSRDRGPWLAECLRALVEQVQDFAQAEILVVDDASARPLAADLAPPTPSNVPVKFLRLTHQHGPAGARNAGLAHAAGELVATLDDDCLPEPGWLATMVQASQAEAAANATSGPLAGVGGRTLPLNTARPSLAPRFQTHHRWLEAPPLRDGHPQYLLTSNALYSRDALQNIGGFDEGFPLPGGEDADLGYRLRQLGYRLAYCPEAVVRHRPKETLGELLITARNYGAGAERNRHKHGSFAQGLHFSVKADLRALLGVPVRALRYRRSGVSVADGLGFAVLDVMVRVAAHWGAARQRSAFPPAPTEAI